MKKNKMRRNSDLQKQGYIKTHKQTVGQYKKDIIKEHNLFKTRAEINT